MVDVTDDAALVAWGAWLFEERDGRTAVVDDDDLPTRRLRTGGTIGSRSAPWGSAVVEAFRGNEVVASVEVDDANHAWLRHLEPDTEYRWRVRIDGRDWMDGVRWDWHPGGPRPSARRVDMRLRTHAHGSDAVPVTFVALGDFGVGLEAGANGERQAAVARTIEQLADRHDVRFLLSLGDTIYHLGGDRDDHTRQSGDEDDDWYLTYFQPYRYLLDHLPMYPTAGNHDGADEEASDDRAQLEDNLHIAERFGPRVEVGRASLGPGLFYRVQVGALLELVCVDTTWGEGQGNHWFDEEHHHRWLEEEALPAGGDGARWKIPFCHHPAYGAGPHHRSMPEQHASLVPLYQRAGVRLVLSGHEHNYQHGIVDGIHYVVSGAAGKLQEDPPFRFDEAGTVAWASAPHCLLVEVGADRITVSPYGPGADGEPALISEPFVVDGS